MQGVTTRWRRTGVCAAVLAAAVITPATLADSPASAQTAVQVWTTTTNSSGNLAQQLAQEPNVTFGSETSQTPQITVNPNTTYQTIQGFGGAMTDSAADLIDHLRAADVTLSVEGR